MEKVILYGGAFNPPTKAHQLITQAAADYASHIGAGLWILPSGERADKSIQVPIEKRLSYVHGLLASIATDTAIQVCDYELKHVGKTRTIDTYSYVQSIYPDTQFIWLFGSDSIQTMPNWSMGELLLRSLDFLIVQREGHEIELQKNMKNLAVEQVNISSSLVRACIASGKPIHEYVPATVLPLV